MGPGARQSEGTMVRTIAMAAFLGSTAMTGAATATALFWTAGATVGVMGFSGLVLMALTAQGAFRDPESLDDRMSQSRSHLSLSRPQIRRAPLGPVTPPSRNGHSRTWPRTARQARR